MNNPTPNPTTPKRPALAGNPDASHTPRARSRSFSFDNPRSTSEEHSPTLLASYRKLNIPVPDTVQLPGAMMPREYAQSSIHAWGPPDENLMDNLFNLLHVELPPVPPPYASDVLQHTKQATQTELSIEESSQLQYVVFVPDLVTQFRDRALALLMDIDVDWKSYEHRELISHIHPWYTSRYVPPVIYSEVDAEKWVSETIFRPVLEAIRAVQHKGLGGGGEARPKYPYLSSAPSSYNIRTDIMSVSSGDYPNAAVKITGEVKAPTVWCRMPPEKQYLADLQWSEPDMFPPGCAMLFNWPQAVTQNDVQTRILVQVWAQIVKNGNSHAILSSYDSTTFFLRDGNTLFMSPVYGPNDDILILTFCWFAVALNIGIDPNSIILPSVNRQWWDRAVKNGTFEDVPGIVPCGHDNRSMPSYFKEELLQA